MSADRSDHPLPLVLIAGQLMTPRIWDPVLPLLPAETDVRFADISSDDSIGGMAERLLEAMPARFDLLGFAMGGFVAFEVLRLAPERVRSLILMSTLAEADSEAQRVRRRGYSDLVEAGKFDEVVEQRLPILFSESARQSDANIAIARDMARATGATRFLRQQAAILNRTDSTASLAAIQCPTLILRGDEDGITSEEHQSLMEQRIPGAKSLTIPSGGHLLPIEAPERLAEVIRAWFYGREPDRRPQA